MVVNKLYKLHRYYRYSVFFFLVFYVNSKVKYKSMKVTTIKKDYFTVEKKQVLYSSYMSNIALIFSLPKVVHTIANYHNDLNLCLYYETIMYTKRYFVNRSIRCMLSNWITYFSFIKKTDILQSYSTCYNFVKYLFLKHILFFKNSFLYRNALYDVL